MNGFIKDAPGRGYQTPEQKAVSDAQAKRDEVYEQYVKRRAGGQQTPTRKPLPERVPMGSSPDYTAPDTTDAQSQRDAAFADFVARRHSKGE